MVSSSLDRKSIQVETFLVDDGYATHHVESFPFEFLKSGDLQWVCTFLILDDDVNEWIHDW
jgi:hypothetical protein